MGEAEGLHRRPIALPEKLDIFIGSQGNTILQIDAAAPSKMLPVFDD